MPSTNHIYCNQTYKPQSHMKFHSFSPALQIGRYLPALCHFCSGMILTCEVTQSLFPSFQICCRPLVSVRNQVVESAKLSYVVLGFSCSLLHCLLRDGDNMASTLSLRLNTIQTSHGKRCLAQVGESWSGTWSLEMLGGCRGHVAKQFVHSFRFLSKAGYLAHHDDSSTASARF